MHYLFSKKIVQVVLKLLIFFKIVGIRMILRDFPFFTFVTLDITVTDFSVLTSTVNSIIYNMFINSKFENSYQFCEIARYSCRRFKFLIIFVRMFFTHFKSFYIHIICTVANMRVVKIKYLII